MIEKPSAAVAVVGAGPRGTRMLERIAAHAPGILGRQRLEIHLVDPYPPGAGRIWRDEQSPLLRMNNHAELITMFDGDLGSSQGSDSDTCRWSLTQWSRAAGLGEPGVELAPDLVAEARNLTARSYASRRLQGAYLRWAYASAVANLPQGVTVHEHRCRAVRVAGGDNDRQRVWLHGRAEPLIADAVVFALGHAEAESGPEQDELASFAERHGLIHLRPAAVADIDLSVLPPGEPVLVRGIGLTFIDMVGLLTEGRGGRFVPDGPPGAGGLTYLPSGQEPILYAGSRRGVPRRAEIGYRWWGEPTPLPRFFGPDQVRRLRARQGALDFARDIQPLILQELGYAHYHRLFAAHPERTRGRWSAFEARFADCEPGSPSLRELVAAHVPDPADRFGQAARHRPLSRLRCPTLDALQPAVHAYLADDLARRQNPTHSYELAVRGALLSVMRHLAPLGEAWSWHRDTFRFHAAGPPAHRIRQLLALAEAGIVRFLGEWTAVSADPVHGVFRAHSATVPGASTAARALVEARVPTMQHATSLSPLLDDLRAQGAAITTHGLLDVSRDGRIRDRRGRSHPRRFAFGMQTATLAPPSFQRRRSVPAAGWREDVLARAVLTVLSAP
ncbi:FAD/NAD(P)-binding protein [Kitasatospora acidiphila]|uniref:FAD/NAD(P)-binding protein n=1 Tax=Kitasatospora acidiphila TaxID=2567942 RepID=UPI003C71754A